MIKLKNIFISAGLAFVFSFLISIISTGKFGTALLRAFLFALLFAAIAGAVGFIYDKFLQVEGEPLASDYTAPKRTAGSAGSQVDLVVDDERLTEEGDGPQFNVSSGMRPLAVKASEPQKTEVNAVKPQSVSSGEEPLKENVGQDSLQKESQAEVAGASGGEALEPVSNASSGASASAAASSDDGPSASSVSDGRKAEREAQLKEIDELPEIGSFDSEDAERPSEGFVQDSDFAQEGSDDDSGQVSVVDGELAKDHDTETMAKAIRTLLKKDG